MITLFLFVLCLSVCLISCGASSQIITYNEPVRNADSLVIHEGILSPKSQLIIKYIKNGKKQAIIQLSAPVCVAQAENEEPWGFYQFPSIGKAEDGTLIVTWQMQADSHESYGKVPERQYIPMISKDGGHSWNPQDKKHIFLQKGNNVYLRNGDYLEEKTPPAKDIYSYKLFPKEVGRVKDVSFFPLDSLPEELQGIYLNYRSHDNRSKTIHATLSDPGALRYAIDGLMPIVWWGNIKELEDNSLIAGVYPALYQDDDGKVMPGGVSFYKSEDVGLSWHIIGKIPFLSDGIANVRGGKSFDEPTFEILSDSSFLCVMRSGGCSPMYQSFSYDKGRTWSKPIPFTPNGVKPTLLTLKNGALVLVSGRPGVQIRFCYDGRGHVWSDPIDLVPYFDIFGVYKGDVSCGYASIIEDDDSSFYIVYSDFTNKNYLGRERKTIFCRKVTVNLEDHDR